MSILQAANVHFDSSGLLRIGKDGSNVVIKTNGNPISIEGLDVASEVAPAFDKANAALANTTTTLNGTLTIAGNTIFNGAIDEKVATLVGTALNPSNGTIQTVTLATSPTLTATTFNEGESMTLMIDDGSTQTITWPTMVWVNNGGVAPTLATTGNTVVALWKVNTTLYGALVGDGS